MGEKDREEAKASRSPRPPTSSGAAVSVALPSASVAPVAALPASPAPATPAGGLHASASFVESGEVFVPCWDTSFLPFPRNLFKHILFFFFFSFSLVFHGVACTRSTHFAGCGVKTATALHNKKRKYLLRKEKKREEEMVAPRASRILRGVFREATQRCRRGASPVRGLRDRERRCTNC
jgi:hypothetical protein